MSWMALQESVKCRFFNTLYHWDRQKLLKKYGHLQVECFKSQAKRQMQIPGRFSKGKGKKSRGQGDLFTCTENENAMQCTSLLL